MVKRARNQQAKLDSHHPDFEGSKRKTCWILSIYVIAIGRMRSPDVSLKSRTPQPHTLNTPGLNRRSWPTWPKRKLHRCSRRIGGTAHTMKTRTPFSFTAGTSPFLTQGASCKDQTRTRGGQACRVAWACRRPVPDRRRPLR